MSKAVFIRHLNVIVAELKIRGLEWRQTQKQNFLIAVLSFGNMMIGLPIYVVVAFQAKSLAISTAVNFCLVIFLITASSVFSPVAKKFIHQSDIKALPLSKRHWAIIAFLFELMSNTLFLAVLVVSYVVEIVIGESASLGLLGMHILCYALVLIYSAHVLVYLNLRPIFSVVFLFCLGALVMYQNSVLVISLLTLLYVLKNIAPRLKFDRLIKFKTIGLAFFFLRESFFIWLTCLFSGLVVYFLINPADSLYIHTTLGFSCVFLFSYSTAWAFKFYRKHSGIAPNLPLSHGVMLHSLVVLVCWSTLIQLLLFMAINFAFDLQESNKLLGFQLVSFLIGIALSATKDELRAPSLILIFLVYLMSLV